MQITDKALAANAITIDEAQLLEDWLDENLVRGLAIQIPPHLMETYNKSMLYLHHGKMH